MQPISEADEKMTKLYIYDMSLALQRVENDFFAVGSGKYNGNYSGRQANWGKMGKEKAKGKSSLPLLWPRACELGWDGLRVCWLICWFLGSANQKFKVRGAWRRGRGCKCKCNEIKYNKANKNRQQTAKCSHKMPVANRSSDWLAPSPNTLICATIRNRSTPGVANNYAAKSTRGVARTGAAKWF